MAQKGIEAEHGVEDMHGAEVIDARGGDASVDRLGTRARGEMQKHAAGCRRHAWPSNPAWHKLQQL